MQKLNVNMVTNKHKKHRYNLKQKIKLVLPIGLLMATPVSFHSCELFKTHDAFVMEYNPATGDCPDINKINSYTQFADYVDVTISVIPDSATQNFTCARMNGVTQCITNAVMCSRGGLTVRACGEIIINKNGHNFESCVYEDRNTPGMYDTDYEWLTTIGIKITTCENQK